jgi:hypothetical protein
MLTRDDLEALGADLMAADDAAAAGAGCADPGLPSGVDTRQLSSRSPGGTRSDCWW